MGIRPRFYILVGIDDAKVKDPRRVKVNRKHIEEILNFRELTRDEVWRDSEGYFDDYHEWELKVPGATLDLSDKLYNPERSNEYAVGNVVGYVVHKGEYDDDILRAMAATDEMYMESGWVRIPTLDPSEHPLYFRAGGYTDEDVANNMFVPSVFENMASISRIQWARAQHYLRLVGWDIPKTDLRYLLVWDWS